MTTREALHRLIDELPDDAPALERVRQAVARELDLWHTAKRIAEQRGWDVGEKITASGGIIFDRRTPPEDPVLQAFYDAPIDDEPVTAEEAAAVSEAQEAIARGEVEPWEQVKRELGLD
jgi:hypothetical protein